MITNEISASTTYRHLSNILSYYAKETDKLANKSKTKYCYLKGITDLKGIKEYGRQHERSKFVK